MTLRADDPRRALLDQLERHLRSPRLGAEERPSVERMIAFVRVAPRCFERAELRGHVTGSAWVLDADRARVILLHHKKLGTWLQPGGHADGDPEVAEVAAKEAREETGIEGLVRVADGPFDVDVHAIPARRQEPAHFHYDVRFLFVAPEGAEPVVSNESHDVRWVRMADVARYTRDRSVLRMLDKWRAGLLPDG